MTPVSRLPTYDAMITWIALNDRGASPRHRKPFEYDTLETVRMVSHLFGVPVIDVAEDIRYLQRNVTKAIDLG